MLEIFGISVLADYDDLRVNLEEEKTQRNEKLFSQIYQNKNGNGGATTKDGYKFIGRGAIQLTGRGNYRDVGNKCNKVFGTSFNWENNPEEVAENNNAIIFSAVAFFLFQFGDNIQLLDSDDVMSITKKVNGGTNGLNERQQYYNEYKSFLYNCNK
jgi:putative chitinase